MTDTATSETPHIFEHVWNNLAEAFRANCSCGVDYEFSRRLADLAEEHDNHLDDVFGADR